MSLKLLMIEEDPVDVVGEDVGHVIQVNCQEPEPDPELPGDWLVEDDLNELGDAAAVLDNLGMKLACEGMDISAARELEKLSPGFIRKVGGASVFTSRPSLEGLAEGTVAVKDKFVEILQRLRDFMVDIFKRFKAWIVAKFSKPEMQDLSQEINEFAAQRRNRQALEYLSSLPEETEEAAAEVARFMDGDTKAFASALVDQLQSVCKRVESLEKAMHDNAVHYRLAKGIVTVEALFEETAGFELAQILQRCNETLSQLLRPRSEQQFRGALNLVKKRRAEFEEVNHAIHIADNPSRDYGDHREVKLVNLFDNIHKAGEELKRVSVQNQIQDMEKGLDLVISGGEKADLESLMDGIPDTIPADERREFAKEIAAFLKLMSQIGAAFMKVWRARVNAIESINQVGDALIKLVDGFENAIVAAASSLQQDQKDQLVKALAGKGLAIKF